jgi:hypothetical protein
MAEQHPGTPLGTISIVQELIVHSLASQNIETAEV